MSYARGDPYRSSSGALEVDSPRGGGGGGGGGGGRWDPERFNRERERVSRGIGRFGDDRDRLEVDFDSPRGGARGGRDNTRLAASASLRRERSVGDRMSGGLGGYGGYGGGGGGGGGGRSRVDDDRIGGIRTSRGQRQGDYYDDSSSDESRHGRASLVPYQSPGSERSRRQSINVNVERRGYPAPPAARGPPARPGYIRRQSSLDTFDRRPMPRYVDREDSLVIRQPINEPSPRPPPRMRRPAPRYDERDYAEIRVAEPDYYGDEDFRDFREREIVHEHTRERSTSRSYKYPRPGPPQFEETTYEEEQPFPRRGKTKMPARLCERSAIAALGYPYEDEGDTIIILKALDKNQIDEVVKVSEEIRSTSYKVQESRMIEAPPSPPPELYERRATEIVIPAPVPPQPLEIITASQNIDTRSLAPRSERSTHRSSSGRRKRSKSHGHSHSHTHTHVSKSRRSSSSSSSSSSDRTRVVRQIVEERETSGPVSGPFNIALPDRRKDEASIKREIKALEREEKALKLERKAEREERRAQRLRDSSGGHGHSGSAQGQTYEIERLEGVKVERNKKGHKETTESDSKLVRAMMATLT
ncbi:MAG: hypothetical protein M1817_006257 [Caeruleum heppii]|nr:MAG: hypothetical protein M1817_006257 [Caeruleum heppii]